MDLFAGSIETFLDAVEAKQPTPGGGAVAGVLGALSAALGTMVVRYAQGKKSFVNFSQVHERAIERLSAMRHEFLELARRDAEAYGVLNVAMALPKDDVERGGKVEAAAVEAMQVPLQCAVRAAGCCELLSELIEGTSVWLRSDLIIAMIAAEAAARAAVVLVEVNASLVPEYLAADCIAEASAHASASRAALETLLTAE